MNRKVAVTAAGVVSPLGVGIEEFACALFAGKTSIAPSPRFPGLAAADLGEFNPQPWLGSKGIRVLDRSARLLAVAAQMALAGAENDPELGLVCGTAFGSVHSIASFDWSGLQEGPSYVSPMEFPNTVISAPAGQAAIKHGLRGVNSTICAGFASGLFAIHYAAEFLRFGRAKALLAGGVEELCEESVLGFSKALTSVAPGEGAALWMLECVEAACARGCTPWFEILGFGSSQDARGIRGAAEAIEQALEDSNLGAGQVSCIVASAGDQMEARALEQVFGERLAEIPVCAPKAAFGEAAGASGALSALVAGLALQQQTVPPTAGYRSHNSRLRLSASAQTFSGDYALVNAFGCDGDHASLVIRLWKN